MNPKVLIFIFAFLAFDFTRAQECTSPLPGPGCYSIGSILSDIYDAAEDFVQTTIADAPSESGTEGTTTSPTPSNQVQGTLYRFRNYQWNKCLAASDGVATGQDDSVMAVVSYDDGTYSIQDPSSLQYIGADHNSIKALDWNGSWEKWYIDHNSDGTVCIRSVHHAHKLIQMY